MIDFMILGFGFGFSLIIFGACLIQSATKKEIKRLRKNNVLDTDILNILLDK